MNKLKQTSLNALLSLLEDEDTQVSTMAMEELIRHHDIEHLVAEHQESPSPLLRSRIHQLGNILNLRKCRNDFIAQVESGSMTLWSGLSQINYQYNPRMRPSAIDTLVEDLVKQLPDPLNTVRLSTFMRSEGFSYSGDEILEPELYLLEDVLQHRLGSPILLSVIARHLGRLRGWRSTVVLFKGKHCLLDSRGHLIEPAETWRITRLPRHDHLHPCGNREIWMTVLCQLFLSAVLEGRLLTIQRTGSILTTLCGGDFGRLPFPLGS